MTKRDRTASAQTDRSAAQAPAPANGAQTPSPTTVKLGRYRHYKGKEYRVVGVARHSETEEELVIYRTLYGDRGLWARPRTMFLETVELDGKTVPRFEWIEPE